MKEGFYISYLYNCKNKMAFPPSNCVQFEYHYVNSRAEIFCINIDHKYIYADLVSKSSIEDIIESIENPVVIDTYIFSTKYFQDCNDVVNFFSSVPKVHNLIRFLPECISNDKFYNKKVFSLITLEWKDFE